MDGADLGAQVEREVPAELRMAGVRAPDPAGRVALPVRWVAPERMAPLDPTAISFS